MTSPGNKQSKPRWMLALAVGLLSWNLLGGYACVQQIFVSLGRTTLPDLDQQAVYGHVSPLYDFLFAAAEISGIAGATLLLLGKSAARSWFLASLILIALQFAFLFATSRLFAVEGPRSVLFPLLVLAIGIVQVWIASRAPSGDPAKLSRRG